MRNLLCWVFWIVVVAKLLDYFFSSDNWSVVVQAPGPFLILLAVVFLGTKWLCDRDNKDEINALKTVKEGAEKQLSTVTQERDTLKQENIILKEQNNQLKEENTNLKNSETWIEIFDDGLAYETNYWKRKLKGPYCPDCYSKYGYRETFEKGKCGDCDRPMKPE